MDILKNFANNFGNIWTGDVIKDELKRSEFHKEFFNINESNHSLPALIEKIALTIIMVMPPVSSKMAQVFKKMSEKDLLSEPDILKIDRISTPVIQPESSQVIQPEEVIDNKEQETTKETLKLCISTNQSNLDDKEIKLKTIEDILSSKDADLKTKTSKIISNNNKSNSNNTAISQLEKEDKLILESLEKLNKYNQYGDEIDNKQKEISKLKDTIPKTKAFIFEQGALNEIKTTEIKIAELTTDISRLQTEKENLTKNGNFPTISILPKAITFKINELSNKKSDLNKKINNLQDENSNLLKDSQSIHEECNALEREIADLQSNKESLEKEIEDIQLKIKNAKDELAKISNTEVKLPQNESINTQPPSPASPPLTDDSSVTEESPSVPSSPTSSSPISSENNNSLDDSSSTELSPPPSPTNSAPLSSSVESLIQETIIQSTPIKIRTIPKEPLAPNLQQVINDFKTYGNDEIYKLFNGMFDTFRPEVKTWTINTKGEFTLVLAKPLKFHSGFTDKEDKPLAFLSNGLDPWFGVDASGSETEVKGKITKNQVNFSQGFCCETILKYNDYEAQAIVPIKFIKIDKGYTTIRMETTLGEQMPHKSAFELGLIAATVKTATVFFGIKGTSFGMNLISPSRSVASYERTEESWNTQKNFVGNATNSA